MTDPTTPAAPPLKDRVFARLLDARYRLEYAGLRTLIGLVRALPLDQGMVFGAGKSPLSL